MQEIVGRGRNIKNFDKIKLTHAQTATRIHAAGFDLRSNNQALTCHKPRDDTDWFVIINPNHDQTGYHCQYGDEVLIVNSQHKNYVHFSKMYQSAASKNYEISLIEKDEDGQKEQDRWLVELVEKTQDQYWRVGELIRIKNRQNGAYLCSHRRRIKENGENEVYGGRIAKRESVEYEQDSKINDESIWLVSELQSFIYTPPLTLKKKIKLPQEVQELNRLNTAKQKIPKKIPSVKYKNENEQIFKMQNKRLEIQQGQRKKKEQIHSKTSCWKKYICCCFCTQESEEYHKVK